MTSRARGSGTKEKKGGTILTSTLREERRLEILYPPGTEFEGRLVTTSAPVVQKLGSFLSKRKKDLTPSPFCAIILVEGAYR